MGELSKKIGEQGEKLVTNFLTILGWNGFQDGESLNCHYPEKHKVSNSPRKTHGVDVFHSTKSQLQDHTLDNVVISVKYTSKPYPVNPSSKFKEHLKDLAHTVECFMSSELRSQNNEDYEMSGINASNDSGVLFWFSNDKNSDQDIVSKISTINLDKSLNFSTIYVVDNSRAAYIYNSIKYVQNNFKDYDHFFHYAFSSSNYKDPDIEKFGKVFPVEYLTSGIIPFRLIEKSSQKVSFCLSSKEEFSEEAINRLLYLASDVSQDFTGEFIFLFPDYDKLKHEAIVNRAKRLQKDNYHALNIIVKSYLNDFRNLINEE